MPPAARTKGCAGIRETGKPRRRPREKRSTAAHRRAARAAAAAERRSTKAVSRNSRRHGSEGRRAPKRAKFDSPGRVRPGSKDQRDRKAPTGRDSKIQEKKHVTFIVKRAGGMAKNRRSS